MKLSISILLAGLATLLLAGCKTAPTSTVMAATLGDAENGQVITVAKNATVTLALTSNPSTGFRWNLVPMSEDKIVVLVSSSGQGSDTGLMGAPGTQTWVFKAVGKGTAIISLNYQRTPPTTENPKFFNFSIISE